MQLFKHKHILEAVAFIVLSVILLGGAFSALRLKDTGGGGGIVNFYAADKNTIDVLVVGSSHAHCTVDTAKLWEDAGISSYILSSSNQTIDTTYYFLKEAFKTQHPKIVFAETFWFNPKIKEKEVPVRLTDIERVNIYRSALLLKPSADTVTRVFEQQKDYGFDDDLRNELLLGFPVFHDRYSELQKSDFVNYEWFKRGYLGSYESVPKPEPKATDKVAELGEKSIKYIDKISELCEKEGAELILFFAPDAAKKAEYSRQNAVAAYCEKKGITFINMNSPEFMTMIDSEKDFRTDEHLNNDGADKVTAYMENIILESGKCEDHRGQKGYELWDVDATFLKDRALCHDLEAIENMSDYMSLVRDNMDRLSVIVSLSGNYSSLGEETASLLETIGIVPEALSDEGGIFVINGNDGITQVPAADNVSAQKVGDDRIYAGFKSGDGTSDLELLPVISIDSVNYAKPVNGMNIVVYDSSIGAVVDCVYADYFTTGMQVLRDEELTNQLITK